MSGTILVVDAVSTNRIVLKVKLSSAHFSVVQAGTARDALRVAAAERPGMIIASASLPDMASATFVAALRAHPDLASIPIVLMLNENSGRGRREALLAGADDVIAQPLDERILLARIRGLLRQHHALEDLRQSAGPACDAGLGPARAGFAEAQTGFVRPGRVALIGGDATEALRLGKQLEKVTPHKLVFAGESQGGAGGAAPDAFVVILSRRTRDAGLKQIAELRAAPDTRHSQIIAIVHDAAPRVAAAVLDTGANDLMTGPVDVGELALRADLQIRHKQVADALRDRLQDGMRAALIDPLTGLYNRRYALPFLRQLIGTPGSRPRPFAVMVADLDHFKLINDTYGHAAGDAVLRGIADLLTANLRAEDMIARIGGEEFLIVLPDTPEDVARRTAGRLCRIVGEAPFPVPGQDAAVQVTISIGVTLIPSASAPAPLSVGALMEEADRALYAAKARGRNTVTYSPQTAA